VDALIAVAMSFDRLLQRPRAPSLLQTPDGVSIAAVCVPVVAAVAVALVCDRVDGSI
jgi:hypothetical protein